jgi:hypothetical protein
MTDILPARLAALRSQAGKHRSGRKLLIFGDGKTGKGFFAGSAPKPIAALACIEPGIVPYLDKSKGDEVLEIYSRNDYYEAVGYFLKKQDKYASVIIDNVDLLFAQIMADTEVELGRDIKGRDWGPIKGLWNSVLFQVGRSKQNCIFTAGRRDIQFTTEEGSMPGSEGRMVIAAQDVPHAEKNVIRFVDLVFKTDIVKNKLNQPTPIHTVTYTGGRRPTSIPPEDLHTGKVWKFDNRKPENVWDKIIAPLDAAWSEGAVEHLGINPNEAAEAEVEMKTAFEQQELGRLTAAFAACKTREELVTCWTANEAAKDALSEPTRKLVIAAKDAKKDKEGWK